jgi:hypothetical protein
MLVARQLARLEGIDRFGVDIRRDLMGAVAGAPGDQKNGVPSSEAETRSTFRPSLRYLNSADYAMN